MLLLATAAPEVVRDRHQLRSEVGIDEDMPVISTVTRLAPQKDLPTMLQAIALMAVPAQLLVVGEGPDAHELRALAARLGIEGRVHWLGWRELPAEFVAASDVFCMSSVWEAHALAAQEAIQLGVPVVSTEVGGMGELIEDGVSGRLVAKADPRSLAAALDEVLGDPSRARAYADAARLHLTAVSSIESMLQRVADVYLGAP